MDIRKIKEQLGRIKVYTSRSETIRALETAIVALKSILKTGKPPIAELRSLLYENIPFILQDPLFKKYITKTITYQPGQEKELLSVFTDIHKKIIVDQEKEAYLTTRTRKQNLDKAFNSGVKFLEQKQISEADVAFTEALTFYRDEHRIFSLIVKALIKTNEFIRATDYIKKGLTCIPEDPELKKLSTIIARIKEGDTSAISEL